MRPVATLLVVLAGLLAQRAHAGCVTDGILLFPAPGAVVPPNTRFILEGAGREQQRVDALMGQELFLKGGSDVVSVKVTQKWISTMKRVALLLEPQGELKAGQSYTLALERLLPNAKLLNGNQSEPRWVAASAADKLPPRYQVKPSVAEGAYTQDANGVSRFLKLRTTLAEEAPAYFVVTLQRSRGSAVKQVYPVPINGGEAMVGHDACSGGFSFEDGRSYRIALEAFDSAGNKALEKLGTIEANAPRPE